MKEEDGGELLHTVILEDKFRRINKIEKWSETLKWKVEKKDDADLKF